MAQQEPSYEELKARLQELEKQVESKKRSGAMEFRVSEKGGVSVLRTGPLSSNALLRAMDATAGCRACAQGVS